MNPGRLEVICGPMFAGKTTLLQERVRQARDTGARAIVLKPCSDTRYATDAVVTHTGERLDAVAIASADELLAFAATHDLIAIDELHFFGSDAVAPLEALRRAGRRIIVAGCDLDHFGDLFAPFDTLIPLADELTRLTGVCASCGAPSTHSERIVPRTERIIIGGVGDFLPRCAACFTPCPR